MENFKKAKKIIERAHSVSILLNPNFSQDSFPAALALLFSLKKLGKNVNLLNTPGEDYLKKYRPLIKDENFHLPRGDFLISVKEREGKIKEISYQQSEEGISLFLKVDDGEIKKEDISLTSLREGGILATLGIADLEEVDALLGNKKIEAIVNIDNKPENQIYGEANLIETTTPSISEIVFDLLSCFDEKALPKETINSLLWGIIQSTKNFQNLHHDSQILQKASFLMEKGGEVNKIISSLYSVNKEKSLRLLGKILSKLKLSPSLNGDLGWAILSEGDFQETNSSSIDLKLTLEKLSSGIFPFQSFFCLWESKNSPVITRGIFYSPQKNLLKKIMENFEGKQRGEGILFSSGEPNPEKVKEEILKIASS